jgi:hypothetical protein
LQVVSKWLETIRERMNVRDNEKYYWMDEDILVILFCNMIILILGPGGLLERKELI